MLITDFFDMIEAHESLEGVSISGDGFVVKHIPTKLGTQVTVEAIENYSAEELLAVMLGEREPDVVSCMTRVVGYYSSVHNWNPSKLGELADRHKGVYECEG